MSAITIRDPLWDTIHVDAVARGIVDSPSFQRLRYIKQLGHAHLVYPGAVHTRFDHAVGVYHLARRAVQVLEQRGQLAGVDPVDCSIIPYAALLHDIGHYPFSHALEELQSDRIPGHHEDLVGRFLRRPDIEGTLQRVAPDAVERVELLIRGRSANPLRGLVSGSLDLDKIEYLKRDAHFCGVPYGEVDVDRLLHSLAVLQDPASGRHEIGVEEKGVAALESLLFAKYQMYRNVYWHHAVRAATVLYKRVVGEALRIGVIAPDELVGATDEALMYMLASRTTEAGPGDPRAGVADGVTALRARRLPKRAAEIAAADIGDDYRAHWLESDSPLKSAVEAKIAIELGQPDGAFLDFPEKPAMFGLDLLLRRRNGSVLRLGPAGHEGLINLPRVAAELYGSARMLRLYTSGVRHRVGSTALGAIAQVSETDAAARIRAGTTWLAT